MYRTRRKFLEPGQFPVITNMPLINLNPSIILLNASPIVLSNRSFGILHHVTFLVLHLKSGGKNPLINKWSSTAFMQIFDTFPGII